MDYVKQPNKSIISIDMDFSYNQNNRLSMRISILIFVFTCTLIANGQEQKLSIDTSAAEMRFYIPPLPFVKPELTLSPVLKLISANYALNSFRYSLTAPISLTEKTNNELQGVWQRELAQQNEGKTWRTILSFIQTGGTAYLLYEHIHKYGLK